jgi:lactobin A/cerein 7B family class IIb bacteriocin
MSFEFESINHCQSDPLSLNIARSHLLEDEKSLSTELGDDELEEVNGGILPLLVLGARLAAPAIIRTVARSAARRAVGEAVMDATGSNDDC